MASRLIRTSIFGSLIAAVIATATPAGSQTAPPAASRAPGYTTAPAFPCGPARHIKTGTELLAALQAEWPRPGRGLSPISVELIADVDLSVKSDKLPGPAYCTAKCTHAPRRVDCEGKGDPCRVPVRFRVNDEVPGVKVDGDHIAREGIHLTVKAGTHFRLMQRVLEFHPETPYYDPLIIAMPACSAECKPAERRCAATGLCLPTDGDSYCLACTGLTRPECACRNADGALKTDGTTCTFRAGDYFPTGACKTGRCEISR